MATVLSVPKNAFHLLQGSPSSYGYTGDSGLAVRRFFCTTCGSPLFSELQSKPDLQFVRCASLDDPTPVQPTMHIYCSSAQPWATQHEALPHYERYPI